MRVLAKAAGDAETEKQAADFAARMREHFVPVLFQKEKGFFVASADADSLEQREVYMAPSIKWDNLFCYDLLKEKQKEILNFFETHLVCEAGIRYAPVWDISYDVDANQMHCYWPAHSETFARLSNRNNRKDLLEKLIGWITYWTGLLMCPEGIDCYNNTSTPKRDCWNSVNGAWQAYSMRGWYEAVIHSVVGVDFNEEGMNLYPYDGEEMVLKNLNYAGKTFRIDMCGSGNRILEVVVNGESLGAITTIPMSCFGQENTVRVVRGK